MSAVIDPTSPWLAEACAEAERDEQACLGAALCNAQAAQVVVGELNANQFAIDSHRQIHDAIAALVARGEGVDVLTVAAEIERTSGWTGTRGRDYLHVLTETTPVAAHAREYCARVAELARQRELRRHVEKAQRAAGELVLSASGRTRLQVELSAARGLLDLGVASKGALPLFDGPALAAMQLDEPQPICEGLIYRRLQHRPRRRAQARQDDALLLDVAAP